MIFSVNFKVIFISIFFYDHIAIIFLSKRILIQLEGCN